MLHVALFSLIMNQFRSIVFFYSQKFYSLPGLSSNEVEVSSLSFFIFLFQSYHPDQNLHLQCFSSQTHFPPFLISAEHSLSQLLCVLVREGFLAWTGGFVWSITGILLLIVTPFSLRLAWVPSADRAADSSSTNIELCNFLFYFLFDAWWKFQRQDGWNKEEKLVQ